LLLLVCAAMLTAFGCGPREAGRKKLAADGKGAFATMIDANGREVILVKKPERVVTCSASFLEPLHEVGGDVVGRPDSRTKMPKWAKKKQSVGRVYNIDLEKVLACQPDLVLINKGMNEKLIDNLTMNGIPSLVLEMKSYDSVHRDMLLLSQVTGELEKGQEILGAMEKEINELCDRVPKEGKTVAILHSTSQGLSVQLESSIAGSVAKRLGFKNVATGMKALNSNPDAAPYSIETLVERNPEIIFITSMGKIEEIKASMEKTMKSNPAWQAIPAVRENRVYYLSQENFLLSPGLNYPAAFKEMAALIYPEAVK